MTTTDLPATYLAAAYSSPGTIATKLLTLPLPVPGPGELLIRLTHSGICRSDLSVMTNGWPLPPTPPNTVGGHEGVGTIALLGPGVAASDSIHLGARVGIKWMNAICNTCAACLAGQDGVCFAGKVSGYSTPGTFAQFAIAPASYVTPIPEGLAGEQAAPMLCGGVTAYSSLRKSGAKPGDWVAMFGAGGGLGHLAVQMAARGMGLRVVGVDHSSKKEIVLESGAETFVAFDEAADVVTEVTALCGGLGAHASLVFTPSMQAYGTAMDVLRFGGRMMCVGIPDGAPEPLPRVFAQSMAFRTLSVRGVAVGNRLEAIECLDMMKRGLVKMHCKVVGLRDLTAVFEEMEEGKLKGRVVIDLWKD